MNYFFRYFLTLIRADQPNLKKLIRRGLKIGNNVSIGKGVMIDPSHCYHILIGNNVTLASRVHILAHDASTQKFLGKTRAANVCIGNNVFIGASTTILPGVHIGDNVIIGAGSIVTKSIPENSVAVGNPARVICNLSSYLEREEKKMNSNNIFHGLWYEDDPDMVNKALLAADEYGEIFVD